MEPSLDDLSYISKVLLEMLGCMSTSRWCGTLLWLLLTTDLEDVGVFGSRFRFQDLGCAVTIPTPNFERQTEAPSLEHDGLVFMGSGSRFTLQSCTLETHAPKTQNRKL